MSLPWFRMYARFITDPVIEELAFDDQRHFVFLLCLKCDGLLDKVFTDATMRERAIARRLGLQGEGLTNAKQRLVESGLIDEDWQPRSWDELQFGTTAGAARQRRWRDRQRGVTRNVTRNVTGETGRSDTDKEKNQRGARAPALPEGAARAPSREEAIGTLRKILAGPPGSGSA